MKNLLNKIAFILPCLCAIFSGCDKNHWDLPPNTSLIIGFSDTSVWYDKCQMDSVHSNLSYKLENLIYYYEDNKKHFTECEILHVQYGPDGNWMYPYYALFIPRIVEKSVGQDIKTFYIDWSKGKTDTLYANYISVTEYDEPTNTCDCGEPLRDLTLNGQTFVKDSEYTNNGVYVFEY